MQNDDNFPRNLKYLASHYHSVAEACRKIGINRQQFNKYLNGSTMPSIHNLKRIADFFGMDEGELLLPHEELVRIVMRRPVGMDLPDPIRAFLLSARDRHASHRDELARYSGFYHSYFRAPPWPGGVLKGLYAVTDGELFSTVKSIERLYWAHKPAQDVLVHKYHGVMVMDADRLYLFEHQPSLRPVYSMMALFASNRSKITDLTGIVTAVSVGTSAKIYSSRVVFRRLDDRTDFKTALSGCGVFKPGSPELDDEILSRLDNSVADGANPLLAAEF